MLYIFDFKFWENCQGNHTRMNILLEKFSDFESYFLYIGKYSCKDKNKIKEYKIDKHHFFHFFPFKKKLIGFLRRIFYLLKILIPNSFLYPLKQSFYTKKKISRICQKKGIDLIWLNYIWNYDFVTLVPQRVMKIIDTHDIQSEIVSNAKANRKFFPSNLNFEEECNLIKNFDMAIAISKRDFIAFNKQGINTYYLPFYFKTDKLRLNLNNQNLQKIKIGFIGGDADFNVAAVNRLIKEIMPQCKSVFSIYLFGKICNKFTDCKFDNVELRGVVKDVRDVYSQVDIMINPVSFGSGLKTKCIESMAYGIPLITTSIGAQGIEDAVDSCFLLGDADNELAECIDNLVNNPDIRNKMSNKQIEYVNENFSDKVYLNLSNKIIGMLSENGTANKNFSSSTQESGY